MYLLFEFCTIMISRDGKCYLFFYLKSILPTSCYNSSKYSILEKKWRKRMKETEKWEKEREREGTATKNCNQSNQNLYFSVYLFFSFCICTILIFLKSYCSCLRDDYIFSFPCHLLLLYNITLNRSEYFISLILYWRPFRFSKFFTTISVII